MNNESQGMPNIKVKTEEKRKKYLIAIAIVYPVLVASSYLIFKPITNLIDDIFRNTPWIMRIISIIFVLGSGGIFSLYQVRQWPNKKKIIYISLYVICIPATLFIIMFFMFSMCVLGIKIHCVMP